MDNDRVLRDKELLSGVDIRQATNSGFYSQEEVRGCGCIGLINFLFKLLKIIDKFLITNA